MLLMHRCLLNLSGIAFPLNFEKTTAVNVDNVIRPAIRSSTATTYVNGEAGARPLNPLAKKDSMAKAMGLGIPKGASPMMCLASNERMRPKTIICRK
jgi:hypothetical protein